MRNASAALIALLNSATQLEVADCLTIIQADGTISRFTSASFPVVVVSQYDNASHTFLPGLPFARGDTKLVIGTEVSSLTVTLSPDPVANLLGGIPWPAAAALGALDNAEVLLEKAITSSWDSFTPGTLILFWGMVGSPVLSRSTIVLNVQSDMVILQSQFPRNIYQPGCLHTLFDAGCTLSRAAFLVSNSASSGSTVSSIRTALTQADDYFNLGSITFTSGVNAGLTRFVRSFAHTNGVVVPVIAFPDAPANGDTFDIVPGCDKKLTTCNVKFSNLTHFRGLPVIPAAEAAR
jgi:uncharacterized phage protein (TIGR02218 family)